MTKVAFLCVFLTASPGAADDIAQGQQLFGLHCAACHGLDARGSGSMASVLTRNPKDLTALSRENGGAFPVEKTVKQVDGRAELKGHGGDMPVYGWFFDGPKTSIQLSDGVSVNTSKPIAQIIRWMETQQR